MEVSGKISNSRYHCQFTCNASKFPVDTPNELVKCIQASIEEDCNVAIEVNQDEKCFFLISEFELPGKKKIFKLRGNLSKSKQIIKTDEIAVLYARVGQLEKRLEQIEICNLCSSRKDANVYEPEY